MYKKIFSLLILLKITTGMPLCSSNIKQISEVRLVAIPWNIQTRKSVEVSDLAKKANVIKTITDSVLLNKIEKELDGKILKGTQSQDFRYLLLILKKDGEQDTLAIPKSCKSYYYGGNFFKLKRPFRSLLSSQLPEELKTRMESFPACRG